MSNITIRIIACGFFVEWRVALRMSAERDMLAAKNLSGSDELAERFSTLGTSSFKRLQSSEHFLARLSLRLMLLGLMTLGQ